MSRRRAFTLIELLIVLGIIVCLLAFLLPMFSKAREAARTVVCASNQRQIVAAMFAYADENHGVLPMPVLSGGILPGHIKNGKIVPAAPILYAAVQLPDWGQYDYTRGVIWPYIAKDALSRERVFNCPSDGANPRFAADFYGSTLDLKHPRNFSYNFNDELVRAVRMTQILQPWHKVLVVEEQNPRSPQGHPAETNPNGKRGDPSEPLNDLLLTTRHTGEANEGFADGHVERVDPGLFQGRWLPNGGTSDMSGAEVYYYSLPTDLYTP